MISKLKQTLQMLIIMSLVIIFFIPAIFIGILYCLLAIFLQTPHIWEVVIAQDKFMAAAFGWSGQYTVSAQCAVSKTLPARILRSILNAIIKDHCEMAARGEGLLLF